MYRILLCLGLSLGGFCHLWAQRVAPLPATINTSYEEREPTPSPDGNTLYFWRREAPENTGGIFDPGDIWFSQKQGNNWGTAQQANYPLNSKGQDFVWQVSPQGDTLWIMHNSPGVNDAGLSYSVRGFNGRWLPPRSLNIRNFRFRGQVKDFFLGPGRVLFLTQTDTLHGFGGSDLYYALPINDTAWARPVSLGREVNTKGNEDAPFLAQDGRTLYFNSNGYGGAGSHEIMVCHRLGDGYRRWSEPQNVGAPINSSGYDFDYFVDAQEKWAYWGSSNPATQSLDLFAMSLDPCQADIFPFNDTTLCVGDTLELQLPYLPGDFTYQWLKDGQILPGAEQASLTVTQTGQYQVIRESAACATTSASRDVRFISPPAANLENGPSRLCLEGALLLQARSSQANQYQWLFNGRKIPGANDYTHYAQAPGRYRLQVANGGCLAESEELEVQRFTKPVIKASSDARGIIPILPQWLWNNKMPREKGEVHVEAMDANQKQQLTILRSRVRGKQRESQVLTYNKQGLMTGQFSLPKTSEDGPRYLRVLPNGDLIILQPSQGLSRFSPKGQARWSQSITLQNFMGLDVDPLGYVYLAAYFDESVDIGGQQLEVPTRGGMILARYTPDGELDWVRNYPVNESKQRLSHVLKVDDQGNAYLLGHLELIGNFGPGKVARAELNRENYFLVSVSTEGETRWVKTFQVRKHASTSTQALGVDGEGNGFLIINQSYWRLNPSGKIQWAGALEGSKGEALASLRISTARRDAYAWALSSKGRYFLSKLNRVDHQTVLWEGRFAGDFQPRGLATTQDPTGNIYLTGISGENSLPGTQLDLTSGSPFFIMKYGPPDGSYLKEPVEICGEKPLSLFVPAEVGLSYQWYLDGEPIPGASAASLPLSKVGTYQVKVGNGDCEQISEPRLVTRCGQDPLEQEMISLASEPEAATLPQEPEKESVIEPLEDDPYSFQGYADNNLILLLDVSGSMRDLDRLPVLQEALIDLVGYMRPEDRISIITYAGGVKTVLDGVSAANQDQIIQAIDQLASSGQTKGKKALRRAYRVAKQNYIDQGNNRVIMATDGSFAIDPLYDLAEKMNRSEIKLSIFSFGKIIERKSDRLEELAQRGGGNYANIRPETVEEALLNEAKAVRRGNP